MNSEMPAKSSSHNVQNQCVDIFHHGSIKNKYTGPPKTLLSPFNHYQRMWLPLHH
jgi:hypothetical protein